MTSSARSRREAVAAPVDIKAFSTVECLILAQAVYELGSLDWSDISETLSNHALTSPPKYRFSPESCKSLYIALLDEASLETTELDERPPQDSRSHQLARKWYTTRLSELHALIAEEEKKFKAIVAEMDAIRSGQWDDQIKAKLGLNFTGSRPLEVRANDNIVSQTETEEAAESELIGVCDNASSAAPAQPPPSIVDESKITEQTRQPPSDVEQSPSPPLVIDDAAPNDDIEPDRDIADAPQDVSIVEVDDDEHNLHTTDVESSAEHVLKYASNDIHTLSKGAHRDHEVDQKGSQSSHTDTEATAPDSYPEASESPYDASSSRKDCWSSFIPHIDRQAYEGAVKRKASDVDSLLSDSQREKKKIREESQPVEEEDLVLSTGSSRRRPIRASNETSQSTKKFQSVIIMLHSQISQHRNGNIFHNPIKNSEAPDYHEIVKRPMDLKTIKIRIKDGAISTSAEFQREVYLMFANSMMYNRPKSDIYNMAEEMMLESEAQINSFRQTEGIVRGGLR